MSPRGKTHDQEDQQPPKLAGSRVSGPRIPAKPTPRYNKTTQTIMLLEQLNPRLRATTN